MQTSSDVHVVHSFSRGKLTRALNYNRDDGGWYQVEGSVQPWERAYFFESLIQTSDSDEFWPDMLCEDCSEKDLDRYNLARQTGDTTQILDLLFPISTVAIALTLFENVTNFCFLCGGTQKRKQLWKRYKSGMALV
jgi:hypothetical protein